MEGSEPEVFARLLRGLASTKLTKPGNFRTADNTAYALRCSYKVCPLLQILLTASGVKTIGQSCSEKESWLLTQSMFASARSCIKRYNRYASAWRQMFALQRCSKCFQVRAGWADLGGYIEVCNRCTGRWWLSLPAGEGIFLRAQATPPHRIWRDLQCWIHAARWRPYCSFSQNIWSKCATKEWPGEDLLPQFRAEFPLQSHQCWNAQNGLHV